MVSTPSLALPLTARATHNRVSRLAWEGLPTETRTRTNRAKTYKKPSPTPWLIIVQQKQKPKWEPPPPARIGKKKRRGPNVANKLPTVTPTARCKLRLLKQLRIKDHLLMEEEVVALYQARAKKKELEAGNKAPAGQQRDDNDETMLATLKGSPLGVGSLEEVAACWPEAVELMIDY
jgi:hypothetical protein